MQDRGEGGTVDEIATLLFAYWHNPVPSIRAQIEAFIVRNINGVTIQQLRDVWAEQHEARVQELEASLKEARYFGDSVERLNIINRDRAEAAEAEVRALIVDRDTWRTSYARVDIKLQHAEAKVSELERLTSSGAPQEQP